MRASRRLGATAKGTCAVLLSLSLAVSFVPLAPPLATDVAHAADKSVEFVALDDGDMHRQNRSFEKGLGESERLAIETSGGTVDSVKWTLSKQGIVRLSSTTGRQVTVSSLEQEGYATVTVTVTFAGGATESDSAVYSVFTRTESASGTITADGVRLTRGPEPGNYRKWTRGIANTGQQLTVYGVCADKFRVNMPDSYTFDNGEKGSSHPVYVDRDKVSVPVRSVAVGGAGTRLLRPGDRVQLKATVAPSIATDKTVVWASSKKLVASVDGKGVVTAKRAGSAVITARSGGASSSVRIDVGAAAAVHTSPQITSKSTTWARLDWERVDGASAYKVQLLHKKLWRDVKTVSGTSCKVNSFFVGKKKTKLKKGHTYSLRVLPCAAKVPMGDYASSQNTCRVKLDKNLFSTSIQGRRGYRTKLKLKKDIYSFINSSKDFDSGPGQRYRTYFVTARDRNKLIKSVVDKNGYTFEVAENTVKFYERILWSGSCFGMSTTIALYRAKKFDVLKKAMYEFVESRYRKWGLSNLAAPANNTSLLSTINYYHMTQSFLSPKTYANKSKKQAKKLIKKTKKGNASIFCFHFANGGHAILLTGKYKKVKQGYILYAYDPNNKKTNNEVFVNTKTYRISVRRRTYPGLSAWAAISDLSKFDAYRPD